MSRTLVAPLILATAIALGACSTPSKPADAAPATSEVPPSSIPSAGPAQQVACDGAKAQWALGKPGDAALLEKARTDAGAKVARLLKPGQMVTMEYSAERLNVRVDAQGVVNSVNCG